MNIPAGWTDDGTTLTAPNGVALNTGMRSFILGLPYWVPGNVPLAPEHEADPVSIASPELGNGTRVDFLECSVGFARATGWVGFLHVGTELAMLTQQQPPAPDPLAVAAKAALKAWLAE